MTQSCSRSLIYIRDEEEGIQHSALGASCAVLVCQSVSIAHHHERNGWFRTPLCSLLPPYLQRYTVFLIAVPLSSGPQFLSCVDESAGSQWCG